MKLQKDKILHAVCCAACSFIITAILTLVSTTVWPALLGGFLAGMCLGIGKEYGDHKAEGNQWCWKDILADLVGAVIGSPLGLLVLIF